MKLTKWVSIVCCIAFLLSTGCTASIPAGHVGITHKFGDVDNGTLPEGLNWVKPWTTVERMSVRTFEIKETADVPTKKGLTVGLEASWFYHLDAGKATDVYKKLGLNYDKAFLETQFRSAMRDATSKYEAEDLYTANRTAIETELFNISKTLIEDRGIVLESVRLRDVKLPKVLADRITEKLSAEQDMMKMTYTLQQAQKEAERKVVEAKGIADAQAIIKKDLDPHYLSYLWIEALKESAKHNNATIYIPTGTDGMPFFKQVK